MVRFSDACDLFSQSVSQSAKRRPRSWDKKLQMFHLRYLCRILGTAWQDRVPNDVLFKAGIHPFNGNAIYAGSAMFKGWKRVASPRIYSTESLPLGWGAEAAPSAKVQLMIRYASFAIVSWNHAILTPSYGKPFQTTETCGSSKYHKDWKAARLPIMSKMMQERPEE